MVYDLSSLKKMIDKHQCFPAGEWEYFESILEIRSMKKGEYLLKQGKVCSKIYFILKGGVRMYYKGPCGKEVSFNFLFENNFVTAFTSFAHQVVSKENITLLEDSILVTIEYNNFISLLRRHSSWEIIFGKLMAYHLAEMYVKEEMLLLDKPEQRYIKVFETRREIFGRVEQRHIASYLGVTPETLSRIKRKVLKNC